MARDNAEHSNLPLASVAMVTYNSERYVAQAVESVLSSSYANLELLICDDCSSDRTWDIIQSYDDPRIRSVRNSIGLGEYANRNQAASLARGEYLIYIDGDDILYPHGLEFMVRMLHAFPNAGMAMARPWSEKFVYPFELSPRELYLCQFLGEDVLAVNFAHLLFRTSALHAVGGLSTRYKTGDTYIQYQVGLKYSSVLISDGLAWWRRAPGQASQAVLHNHLNWLESLEFKRALLADPACPLTARERQVALSNLYGSFLRLVFAQVRRSRLRHAYWLLAQARIPKQAWSCMFIPSRNSYLRSVTAMNPRSAPLRCNPLARNPPGA
jgi:glycosyltransferase involved in cell wall biosynthesis